MPQKFYRKCVKCGVRSTDAMGANNVFHRFPKPGASNILRATAWATYCWPEKDWSTVESLEALNRKGGFLCHNHFQDTFYVGKDKKLLSKYAVPGTTEFVVELLHSLRLRLPSMGKQLEEDMEKISKNLKSVIGKTTRVDASIRSVANCELPPRPVSMTESTSQDTDQCYACNECKETITGFRYTCLQCADWDLCGACEVRAAHDAHYLLRIPTQGTNKEIQAVLAVIRHQLLSEVLLLPDVAVSVKVKSEPEELEDTAGPTAEPDPLGYPDKDDCVLDVDNIPKDSEKADYPTPRKRIRSGTPHSRSDQNALKSPDSNPTLRTLRLHHHDNAKPAQNIHKRKLPNGNRSNPNLGLVRVPHHSASINVPTRKVTSQLPLKTRVTKKVAILRRPPVISSPSEVKATPRREDQGTTATTEVSPSTSTPELDRATTAVKRLFLKLPSGSNPADIIKSLRSKATVRLKRIDISQSRVMRT